MVRTIGSAALASATAASADSATIEPMLLLIRSFASSTRPAAKSFESEGRMAKETDCPMSEAGTSISLRALLRWVMAPTPSVAPK